MIYLNNHFKVFVIAFAFISVLTCLTILFSENLILKSRHFFLARYIPHCNTTPTTEQTRVTPKVFLVLLWTPYYLSYNVWPKMENLTCKYRNCELTHDRGLLNASDAVLFHWRADFNFSEKPATHNRKQMWILFNQESPIHTYDRISLAVINQINWTMTYRRDSDIYAPYGEIVKCDNRGSKTNNEFKDKIKNVAWIVSNCQTPSKREQYVKELRKYIDVDIYGYCGKLSCDRFTLYSHPSCLARIASEYKFYLSFENSICNDYVSEKLFNAAQYDIIPVVRGGANYSAIMPHNSYIDAFNFSSPKQLAQYLHVVGSDPIKYNSYMSWKQNYCSVNTDWNVFCNLCDALNKSTNYTSKNTNLIDWWFRGGNCSVNAHL